MRTKLLVTALLALLSTTANADVWRGIYGQAKTFNFVLFNSDGTLDVDESDGGTEVSLSCDQGAETTATNDFVDEGTFYSIAITAAEMRCRNIAVVIAATGTNVFFIQTDAHPGVIAEGTAQAATGTTLQLAAAETFADDEINGATCIVTGGSAGVGQSRAFTNYVSTSDTGDVATWTTTPTGTITYQCHATAPGAAVSIAAGGISSSSFAAGAIDSSALGANAITDAKVASDVTIASVTGSVGSVTGNVGGNVAGSVGSVSGNVSGSVGSVVGNVGGNVVGNVNGSVASIGTNGLSAASLAADAGTEVGAAVLAAQGILTGTCDSGSTTTCVDDGLTQADATQLEDRIACFSDGWCGLITTFAPGSDTATFTKVAPSTRAAKTYTIFPATLD